MIPPAAITAMNAVLPKGAVIAAVGGISAETMAPYRAAGVMAFGLGSALFKPEYSVDDIRRRADIFIDAVKELK